MEYFDFFNNLRLKFWCYEIIMELSYTMVLGLNVGILKLIVCSLIY